jgi:hypothetical protein
MNNVLYDELSNPHWSALAGGSLMIQQCVDCGTHQWYPRDWCLACDGSDVDWVAVSGHGELATWTIACTPEGTESAVAVVVLREGVQVFGELTGYDDRYIRAGAPVTFIGSSAASRPRIQWKVEP